MFSQEINALAIQANPSGRPQLLTVGREQTPVLIIDDFAQDTRAIREHATTDLAYGPDASSRYPGLRAGLPRDYVLSVLASIHPLLYRMYRIPQAFGLRPVNAVYSLITTPPESLEPAQRIPHFDSARPHYLAVLHYLAEGDFCGTGLFRHRATGMESVSEERLDAYLAARQAQFDQDGEPPAGYITGNTNHYELYETIAYRPNRLVVYPGRLFHSGLVDPLRDVDADPRSGRLTANLFIDFEVPIS